MPRLLSVTKRHLRWMHSNLTTRDLNTSCKLPWQISVDADLFLHTSVTQTRLCAGQEAKFYAGALASGLFFVSARRGILPEVQASCFFVFATRPVECVFLSRHSQCSKRFVHVPTLLKDNLAVLGMKIFILNGLVRASILHTSVSSGFHLGNSTD